MDQNAAAFGRGIADYKVGTCIGSGGFSDVHVATSLLNGKCVAIKYIPKKMISQSQHAEAARSRVLNEFAVHNQLKNPFIASLYTFFQDDDYFYLVMEHCDETLEQYLKVK